ncbi:hypothetical protein EPL05_13845 [Mucilaginibacter gilvus]|uniref:Uncharacterized protein n=1 Tax=Mucilaginibacter gilvus TaxID=2305909 RepID=A0A3S3VDM1_9SPHI|nr:hypothetical protein EPL05_13845 [Mucilaginibacter gilvus]
MDAHETNLANKSTPPRPDEALLPELIKRAAGYGMEAFAKSTALPASANKIVVITGGSIVDVEKGVAMPNGVIILQNGLITK